MSFAPIFLGISNQHEVHSWRNFDLPWFVQVSCMECYMFYVEIDYWGYFRTFKVSFGAISAVLGDF